MKAVLKSIGLVLLGVITGGAAASTAIDNWWTRKAIVANREHQAAIAELCARSLARLRTGPPEAAIAFLEDRVDSYAVGVPMGESYSKMTGPCQRAMATVKTYRSQFPFSGECAQHGKELHYSHLPAMLSEVPILSADHEWLDTPMKAVAKLQPASAKP
jgi:hypothetical protein